MKDFLKKIKSNLITTAVIFIIIGLLLLLAPGYTASTVCLILGWGLLIMGVANLISYFVSLEHFIWYRFDFISGMAEAVFGLFIIINPYILIDIINLIFGVILIVHGISGISRAFEIKGYSISSGWIFSMVLAAVTLILGLIIMINPFGANIILRIIGICLLYTGISDFVSLYRAKKVIDNATTGYNSKGLDGYEDVDYRDVR